MGRWQNAVRRKLKDIRLLYDFLLLLRNAEPDKPYGLLGVRNLLDKFLGKRKDAVFGVKDAVLRQTPCLNSEIIIFNLQRKPFPLKSAFSMRLVKSKTTLYSSIIMDVVSEISLSNVCSQLTDFLTQLLSTAELSMPRA